MIKKYGDLYGAERIAELLGLDKSALDFNPTEETVAKEASLVSWWEIRRIKSRKNRGHIEKKSYQPFCIFSRLSSIDTKYHIWKMGVVFTDNVSLNTIWLLWIGRLDGWILINSFLFFLCQSFLYLVWYTTMSILGHYNNFFFAAHLLDIAMGFKTLRTILSSVTHNGKQVRIGGRSSYKQQGSL